ncbi:MAG: DUF6206 family protein [Promethearchaeota archaeon]
MKINLDILKKLERSIDTLNPEGGQVPINILGYGEISLVFELVGDPEKLAYKRIPIFDTEKQVKRHIWAYNEYNKILKEDIGLNLPDYDVAWFKDDRNHIQFYCVQEKIPAESVGNRVIHFLPNKDIFNLILLTMREMKKVWSFAKNNKKIDVGLDGQISNFSVIGFDLNSPKIDMNTKLYYLDTSTPMFRINGAEAMEAVLFLKSAPSFLRWLLKALFLEETVGRYYEWRKVAIDLVANFYKEQKPELVPSLINLVNKFFEEEASDFEIEPLNLEEIKAYYADDARMWVIFQKVRQFDRLLKTKVFKKRYEFYLPEEIKR